MADIQANIDRANEQLKRTPKSRSPRVKELTAARDAAVTALDWSRGARGSGSADPWGAFAKLTKADADLTRRLAALAEEQATAERLNRAYEQALFTAESRVRAVSEYIDTRRGSIGPDARTRLAEAKRQLQAAHDKRTTNLLEATACANGASAWAANAQSLANADVLSAQRAYSRRGGDNTGALIGGIIINDLLSGGTRGGLGGGWIPTSFGGSSSSSGGSSGEASWAAAGGSEAEHEKHPPTDPWAGVFAICG